MTTRYRLGFLLCDRATAAIAARFRNYADMYEHAFRQLPCVMDWVTYDVTAGEVPANAHACDGYLISGSRHSAYDSLPWIAALIAFVRVLSTSDRPTVGLCFGHQILGYALGGRVARAPQGWGLGIGECHTLIETAWMRPPRPQFAVPICHQDHVLELPVAAQRLARSDHCENFIVLFAGHLLGIQGHPEFERAFLAALIDDRRAQLPPEVSAAAAVTLTRPDDSRVLKHWIADFLQIPLQATAEASP